MGKFEANLLVRKDFYEPTASLVNFFMAKIQYEKFQIFTDILYGHGFYKNSLNQRQKRRAFSQQKFLFARKYPHLYKYHMLQYIQITSSKFYREKSIKLSREDKT